MMKRLRAFLLALAAIALIACAWQTRAIASVEAPQAKLVIRLQRSGRPIPDAQFRVYRVGDFDEVTGEVTLDDAWLGFDVSGVNDQRGWARASQDMAGRVSSAGIVPVARASTGADGIVAFTEDEGMAHGLYLVVGDDVAFEGRTYSSLPFIVGLPSWDFEERSWCYEVIAEPKPGERAPSDDAPTPALTPSAGGPESNAAWPFGLLPKTGDLLAAWSPWLGLGIIIATLGFRLREDS